MKKRMISRALALFMALSLLSTTAFAASFTDLQDAINGTEGKGTDLGNDRYGYAAQTDDTGIVTGYGIEAWTTTGDDGSSTRNVLLNEDVTHQGTGDTPYIDLGTTRESDNLVLDLNSHKIDGNQTNTKPGAQQVIVAAGTATIKDGTITGSLGSGIMSHTAYVNEGQAVNLTLENVDVTGNYGTGISLAPCNEGSSFTMTGGSVKNNGGAGVTLQQLTFSIDSAVISDNGTNNSGTAVSGLHLGVGASGTVSNTEISGNVGRGVFMASNTKATFDNVYIHDNAGGIITGKADLTINNSTIINNQAPATHENGWAQAVEGGGIKTSGTLYLGEGNEIHSNTSQAGNSDIYATAGATINGLNKTLKAPKGEQFDGWYTQNGEGDKYAEDGTVGNDVDLVGSLTDAPVEEPAIPTPSDTTIPNNSIPGEYLLTDAAATTIADSEVPLAGLITVAQLLEALRQHEGIEDVELPEDFQWADHEYAQAIFWGLDEALVLDTEEDPFDPDEIVTVAILKDVMTNYAAYLDTTFDVVIEDEDDMIVMNCDEILAEFYASLEAQAA